MISPLPVCPGFLNLAPGGIINYKTFFLLGARLSQGKNGRTSIKNSEAPKIFFHKTFA
tara:strand:- start:106 stop:279 length:174 start_codon:yes stop_codon:yes gene_type:complete